ncbi:hypothetical protein [Thalassospira marina]|uniref:Uncharacterized protein n=1 Tax=Thalassospira marina TaxID=2048283 RepID=A0A2N3KVB4_9PROT|nr:hypothetical protein [Thalassospira marina]PKR54426.1 hypothetical protein COO20_09865 [Thalassospira marina]
MLRITVEVIEQDDKPACHCIVRDFENKPYGKAIGPNFAWRNLPTFKWRDCANPVLAHGLTTLRMQEFVDQAMTNTKTIPLAAMNGVKFDFPDDLDTPGGKAFITSDFTFTVAGHNTNVMLSGVEHTFPGGKTSPKIAVIAATRKFILPLSEYLEQQKKTLSSTVMEHKEDVLNIANNKDLPGAIRLKTQFARFGRQQ